MNEIVTVVTSIKRSRTSVNPIMLSLFTMELWTGGVITDDVSSPHSRDLLHV